MLNQILKMGSSKNKPKEEVNYGNNIKMINYSNLIEDINRQVYPNRRSPPPIKDKSTGDY